MTLGITTRIACFLLLRHTRHVRLEQAPGHWMELRLERPREGVVPDLRLLRGPEDEETLRIGHNHIQTTLRIVHKLERAGDLVGAVKLIAVRPGENHPVGVAPESDDRG